MSTESSAPADVRDPLFAGSTYSSPDVGPEVSIIIVNWNARAYLRDCLASIQEHVRLPAEIILVDNASSDGSVEMVRREFPQVRLFTNPVNRGFAAANNQGLAAARGHYFLLLNPDTVILDDCVARTVEYADANPDIGVLGCQVLESETRVQRTCFRDPSLLHLLLDGMGLSRLFPSSALFNRQQFGGWRRDCPRDVDVVSGMYMLVRASAAREVGLMDEDFFVYAEEADWCRRFRRTGWRCVFAPVGRILHCDGGGQSTRQVSVPMYVQLHKSLLIYHRKHYGWFAALLARVVLLTSMVLRWSLWQPQAWVWPRAPVAHQAQCARAALRHLLWGIEPCR